MSAFCYAGGFAALPRPYPGLPELAAVAVLAAGAVRLRSLARADGPSSTSHSFAVAAFSLGAATLVVTTVSRFGCRLGLRPAAAVGLGVVVALVAASVGGR